MALTPEKLVNYSVYGGVGSIIFMGLADVELPKFESVTDTIRGAGVGGEYESPVIGHFKAMSVKLKWRAVTSAALGLLAPTHHVLDIRQSVQVQDPMLGALATEAWRVEVRGPSKMLGLGKLEPGKPTDAECEISVAKIIVSKAGVPIVEFDPFNMVYKVNGFDHLRSVR
ncbi:MAG: hypothetical protein RL139_1109, partial [Gemmatimonadota bacterium]